MLGCLSLRVGALAEPVTRGLEGLPEALVVFVAGEADRLPLRHQIAHAGERRAEVGRLRELACASDEALLAIAALLELLLALLEVLAAAIEEAPARVVEPAPDASSAWPADPSDFHSSIRRFISSAVVFQSVESDSIRARLIKRSFFAAMSAKRLSRSARLRLCSS